MISQGMNTAQYWIWLKYQLNRDPLTETPLDRDSLDRDPRPHCEQNDTQTCVKNITFPQLHLWAIITQFDSAFILSKNLINQRYLYYATAWLVSISSSSESNKCPPFNIQWHWSAPSRICFFIYYWLSVNVYKRKGRKTLLQGWM